MKKLKIYYILITLAVFYLFHPNGAFSQSSAKVENINFYAEGSKLIITYDIVKAKPGETFDIWIKIVTASGKEISPITFSGDAESGITGGQGKKIIWDVQADNVVLDEEFSVEVFARVEKKSDKNKSIVNGVLYETLSPEDVFNPGTNKFYWLGIDFSHVKLIGEIDIHKVKDVYFPAINGLILNERDKYDIKGMFKLRELQDDIGMITQINAETDAGQLEAINAPGYNADQIQFFVRSYKTEGKSGIGLVLIAEALNKNLVESWFHITAINLETKDVLFTERLRGVPGGIGFRNYWANSINEIIVTVKKSEYKSWKAKYSK